jgi:hypothetical protein
MASKVYKDQLAIVTAVLDKATGKWTAKIEISQSLSPSTTFDSEKEAEEFGLRFATNYIEKRTQ